VKYVICPQCKSENSGSMLVCERCGADLVGIERLEKPGAPEYMTPSAPLPGIPVSPTFTAKPLSADQLLNMKNATKSRMLKGANWFFWIAGLSVVNSVLARGSSETRFILGLGSTQFLDGIAIGLAEAEPSLGVVFHAAAIVLDLILLGLLVLFGILGRKGIRVGFIIGIILYALDALIFLMVKDYLGVIFHLLALVGLYSGMRACYEYGKLNKDQQTK
jgi:hypothetical protein